MLYLKFGLAHHFYLKHQLEMMGHVPQEALKDHCHATNPRIATAEDYLQIMRDAA